MNSIIFPKEWYIAQTKWLNEELSKIPLCKLGKHRGNTVVRLFSDKTNKVCKEVSSSSKNFSNYAYLATKRQSLIDKIRYNKNILTNYYNINYEYIKDSYVIIPNTSSYLNSIYWNRSIATTNTHTNDNNYCSNGINYRSRFEMNFASECTNLGIDFCYEPKVFINDYKDRFADFGFYFPMFNRCAFIELLGSMNNYNYVYDTKKKLSEYIDNNFYIGRDLFILCGDEIYIPGQIQLQSFISTIISTMCEIYVKRTS